jgi:transposase-like protein
MALEKSALLELLEALKAAGVDERIRLAVQSMYQALIDAEAEGAIGAGFWERTEARTAIRNGSRQRLLSTTAGDLELRIPKLRSGSFFPSLLERRRRIDQALFAVSRPACLPRGLDAEGRRSGKGPGRGHRDLQVGGLADLQGPR